MVKADLHIHTTFSDDSEITPEVLITRVQELGLSCVAVVDHNTAAGALKVQEMNPPFILITGEEILTPEGEIIGLFLKDTIAPGLTPEETIKLIHAQGGLACIPHPFDRFRSSAMQQKTLERIVARVDIIEVANARTLPMQDLTRPEKFARQNNKAMGAGSDSHSSCEIGRAFVELPDFSGPDEFLKALACGNIHRYQVGAGKQTLHLARRLVTKLSGKH